MLLAGLRGDQRVRPSRTCAAWGAVFPGEPPANVPLAYTRRSVDLGAPASTGALLVADWQVLIRRLYGDLAVCLLDCRPSF
jgi:hypothetical protein